MPKKIVNTRRHKQTSFLSDISKTFAKPTGGSKGGVAIGDLQGLSEKYGRNIWGCDLGQNSWYIQKNGEEHSREIRTVEEFLELDFCFKGDLIIVENAHLQTQKDGGSLAQPYTFDQLEALAKTADQKGAQIKLVPHCLATKIRQVAFPGAEKADELDCFAVAWHLFRCDASELQPFKPKPYDQFSNSRNYGFDIKKNMDDTLNKIRNYKRSSLNNVSDIAYLSRLLDSKYFFALRAAVESEGGQAAKDAMAWILSEMTDKDQNVTLLSLWVALHNEDGTLRTFPWSEKPLGLNYVWKEPLGNRPNHFRGGVGRSNLWHWTFRSIVNGNMRRKVAFDIDTPDRLEMIELRKRFRKACFLVMREMQNLAVVR